MLNLSETSSFSPEQHRGYLITLDGIDRCGKSTQLGLLQQMLTEQGLPVLRVATSKENPNVIDHLIRDVIDGSKEPVAPKALAYLFAASGVIRQETYLIPQLESGAIILSDRYVYSGYAYNMAMKIGDRNWNDQLFSYVLPATLAIYIDISVDTALKRRFAMTPDWSRNPSEIGFATEGNFIDHFVNLQTEARNIYLDFVNQGKMVLVSGESPIDKVHQEIASLVSSLLGFNHE